MRNKFTDRYREKYIRFLAFIEKIPIFVKNASKLKKSAFLCIPRKTSLACVRFPCAVDSGALQKGKSIFLPVHQFARFN